MSHPGRIPARAARAVLAALALGAVPPSASATEPLPIAWDGQFRTRYEIRAGAATPARSDVALLRMRLGARAAVGPGVAAYVQFQDARTMGEEGSVTANLRNADLRQAWVQLDSIGGRALFLRVGRQELAYGDERLVSPLDWSNTGRAWDGVRGWAALGDVRVEGFHTWVVERGNADRDDLFNGVHVARATPKAEENLYAFARHFPSARTFDVTYGARVRRAFGRLDARAEAAGQDGRRGAGDEPVAAWGAAAKLSYEALPARRGRVALEAIAGSGSRAPSSRRETFEPPFPLGHAYLGTMDLVGWSNVRDLNVGVSGEIARGVTGIVEVHDFELMEPTDAWYDAAGRAVLRASPGDATTDLGRELDLMLRWTPRPKVALAGGYGRFWSGDFPRNGNAAQDWGWLQMTVGF